MRDLYSVLGVSRSADQDTIRKAYKKLARKYHPDLNKEPGADDRFKEVTTAYEVLSDEQRRGLFADCRKPVSTWKTSIFSRTEPQSLPMP